MLPHVSAVAICYTGDEEEWHQWQQKGDPVLHIDLRKWADLLVIAPLSANTLAKVAQGLCDNCLTSVVRAWDFSKPLVVSASSHPAVMSSLWFPTLEELQDVKMQEVANWQKMCSPELRVRDTSALCMKAHVNICAMLTFLSQSLLVYVDQGGLVERCQQVSSTC